MKRLPSVTRLHFIECAGNRSTLTAFLLCINDVIPEDQILDVQSLPKVKMPTLRGYPY